jgi:hypothetical protein
MAQKEVSLLSRVLHVSNTKDTGFGAFIWHIVCTKLCENMSTKIEVWKYAFVRSDTLLDDLRSLLSPSGWKMDHKLILR